MNLILNYDASCDSAPAGFERVLNHVALIFDETFTPDVTVTISVGFGEIDGTPIGAFDLGESDTTFTSQPDAASPNGQIEVPTDGGAVGFSDIPMIFDYKDEKPPASKYDFKGAAEHEITEVMGRQLLAPFGQGYTALDLIRYSAPGVPDTSATFGGYASADGGVTNLGTFNTNHNGDPGDWQGLTNDSFNAFSNPAVRNPMSANDLAVMNAIGWTNGGVIEAAHAYHHV